MITIPSVQRNAIDLIESNHIMVGHHYMNRSNGIVLIKEIGDHIIAQRYDTITKIYEHPITIAITDTFYDIDDLESLLQDIDHYNNNGQIAVTHDDPHKLYQSYALMEIVIADIINKKKQELDIMQSHLNRQIRQLRDRIININRAINLYDLFVNIDNQIITINDGISGHYDSIVLYQSVLYMDELISIDKLMNNDHTDFTYTNVEEFYEWIAQKDKYERYLPHRCSMAILHPKRYAVDFNHNYYYDYTELVNNSISYVIIRSDDNISVIQLENFSTNNVAFHSDQYIRAKLDTHTRDYELYELYQKRLLSVLVQSIYSNTDIMGHRGDNTNIINKIIWNYNYYNNTAITDGRMSIDDWIVTAQSKLRSNDTVMVAGIKHFVKDCQSKSYAFVKDYTRFPELPQDGLYKACDIKSKNKDWHYKFRYGNYCIRYKPSDQYYSFTKGYVDRSQNVSLILSSEYNNCWIPIDYINETEVDYYLNHPAVLQLYRQYAPLLVALKQYYNELNNTKQNY